MAAAHPPRRLPAKSQLLRLCGDPHNRRNWLFFGDEEGARLGPILMSLVQSCKELAINPLLYLTDVLKAISTTPADRVAELTPRGWQRRQQAKAASAAPEHVPAVTR